MADELTLPSNAWHATASVVVGRLARALRREHPAFGSLAAVRTTLERTYDPACIGQLEQLLDTLREAGLPAQ